MFQELVGVTTIKKVSVVILVVCVGGVGLKMARKQIIDLGPANSKNTFPKGQCTWYAFERTRIRFTQGYGRNAKQWPLLAASHKLVSKPTKGSVMVLDAWKGNPYGHVAYVEAVQGMNHWTISHANMSVGEDFAKLGDIQIRKVECVSNPNHTISFKGFRHQFHLLGFLTPR